MNKIFLRRFGRLGSFTMLVFIVGFVLVVGGL